MATGDIRVLSLHLVCEKDYGGNTLKRRIGKFFSALRLSGAPQPVIGNKAFRKYLKEELVPPADKEAVRLIEEGPDWTVGEGEVKVSIRF